MHKKQTLGKKVWNEVFEILGHSCSHFCFQIKAVDWNVNNGNHKWVSPTLSPNPTL